MKVSFLRPLNNMKECFLSRKGKKQEGMSMSQNEKERNPFEVEGAAWKTSIFVNFSLL